MTLAGVFLFGSAVALVPAPQSLVVTGGESATGAVVVCATDPAIPPEGYRLSVGRDRIDIVSSDEAGRLYARVTLDQLRTEGSGYACCRIEDAPAYPWRGFLVDVSRHFLLKDSILDLLDVMVLHKFNVLHWHLTDDQAWRIPLARYPRLMDYATVRPYNPRGQYERWHRVKQWVKDPPGLGYGPYAYTRREIDEVLAYAKARHVKVVPEVNFPGHMRAVLAAYPEFGCRADVLATNRVPRATWGVEEDILCIGNDRTVQFVMDLLDEICEMFPDSDVIHIGGEECRTKRWKACPRCQARMRAEGLGDESELQTWLVKKAVARLAAKGRKAIGWAEIIRNPGLDRAHTMVMPWVCPDPGLKKIGMFCPTFEEIADLGFDIVAGSHKHVYWGFPQSRTDEYDPQPDQGPDYFQTSLEDVYSFDMTCGAPRPGKGRIVGAEAYAWGETCWNFFDYMYKSFPRSCAVAELCWTAPKTRDYKDFYARMLVHARRLRAMKIPCAEVPAPGVRRVTPSHANTEVD